MIYYAVREKIKHKYYLSGTDFGDYSQLLASKYSAPKLFSGFELKGQIFRRRIDLEKFEIVPVIIRDGIMVSGSAYAGFPPELEEASL